MQATAPHTSSPKDFRQGRYLRRRVVEEDARKVFKKKKKKYFPVQRR